MGLIKTNFLLSLPFRLVDTCQLRKFSLSMNMKFKQISVKEFSNKKIKTVSNHYKMVTLKEINDLPICIVVDKYKDINK